jgi:hypothetical protein
MSNPPHYPLIILEPPRARDKIVVVLPDRHEDESAIPFNSKEVVCHKRDIELLSPIKTDFSNMDSKSVWELIITTFVQLNVVVRSFTRPFSISMIVFH